MTIKKIELLSYKDLKKDQRKLYATSRIARIDLMEHVYDEPLTIELQVEDSFDANEDTLSHIE